MVSPLGEEYRVLVRVSASRTRWPGTADLLDRGAERRALDALVQALRAGESRALVVRGDSGVGKTALLDYVADHAPGCRVERITGIRSEMELPWAALHQLCLPFLDRLDSLPGPQRSALETSFGLATQPAGDPFLVGLAVLGLLSEAAQERPLVCLVDDQPWLDFASARILGFVARRLGSESLGIVFTSSTQNDELVGLPSLTVGGLAATDAGLLLDRVHPGKLDLRVRDRIVAETNGNPLALVELTRGMSVEEMAFGLELPGAVSLDGTIEESFGRRIDALPDETRRLLVLAAAEPAGDPDLLGRAGALLGIGPEAQDAASEAGLAEFRPRVRFCHPLARSASYGSGSAKERQQAHSALAAATDAIIDPERRAWHRSQAVDGPDEDVAEELEAGARLAFARGCLAAAGAYLHRAVALSRDPVRRTDRAISAAEGKIRSGAFDTAVELLGIAQAQPITDLQRARLELVQAQLTYVTRRGGEAPVLLLKAAQRLESVDSELALTTYLDALSAAVLAGRLAAPGGDVLEVAAAARALPPVPGGCRQLEELLRGVAANYLGDPEAGSSKLRESVATFGSGMSVDDELRWIWLVCMTAMSMLEDGEWASCSKRHLQLARQAGALSELPLALNSRTFVALFAGYLAEAERLVEETDSVKAAIRSELAPYGALGLAAMRGEAKAAGDLFERTMADVHQRGEGIGITIAEWAKAALHNGLGDYDSAADAAIRGSACAPDLKMVPWPLAELVEAAARTGSLDAARRAFRELSTLTRTSGTNWAMGLEARCQALISEAQDAEQLYRDAITHLGATRQRSELARAHLVYGEWLRRHKRRTDSRDQLDVASQMFETSGMEAFANRARREMRVTNKSALKRGSPGGYSELTPQESQVARLARDGLTNPEIGTRLFISAHTVQYHLRKVFAKLGIASRVQLADMLPPDPTGDEVPRRQPEYRAR